MDAIIRKLGSSQRTPRRQNNSEMCRTTPLSRLSTPSSGIGSVRPSPRTPEPINMLSHFRYRLSPTSAQDLSTQLFTETEPIPPPPIGLLEQQYPEWKREGGFTQTVAEDLTVLANLGFEIEMSQENFVGQGNWGSVYRGRYGQNAQNLRDKNGISLRNVEPGATFAVKIVDFRKYPDQVREAYEVEKEIMTFANHKNIMSIRMAISMGEPRTFQFKHNGDWFQQHDRVYLIMDLAELGSLKDYLRKYSAQLQPHQRIKLIRDCYSGLNYLHQNHTIHADLHTDNILVFEEDGGICAKLADFGMGWVDERGYNTHHYVDSGYATNAKYDVKDLARVVDEILKGWVGWEESEASKRSTLDQFWNSVRVQCIEMKDFMLKSSTATLDEVLYRYLYILSELYPINEYNP